MKKYLITLVIALIGTISQAKESELLEIAQDMGHMYKINGRDNNYLESKVINLSELGDVLNSFEGKTVNSRSKLKNALRYCVFQTKGAYGEHFDNAKAWQIAGIWTSRLRREVTIAAIYRLEGKNLINWEIISAPCALAIEIYSGDILILQGMGVD